MAKTSLIQWLKCFNSKERFLLVGQALGNRAFKLDDAFKKELGAKTYLTIPENAFVAMDYHLDWIYAALFKFSYPDVSEPVKNDGAICGQQEDVDLLVVFEQDGTNHVIMIEAKGVTSWTNRQIKSKTERFSKIFGSNGKSWPQVMPHLVLMSPEPPKKLSTQGCPEWILVDGKFAHIKLALPDDVCLQRVTRCCAPEKQEFTHWIVAERKIRTGPAR